MEKLKKVMSLCKNEVSLSINEHKSSYTSVAEYLEDMEEKYPCEKEVYDKMVELDTMIRICAYPDNAIGFYSVYHYDIDQALDIMLRTLTK